MDFRGVHYDTGVRFIPGRLTRDQLHEQTAAADMRVIRDELHANAVRIVGDDVDRIVLAARCAHAAGLAVFFSPWLIDRDEDALLPYLRRAANLAERLRETGQVTFVTGCEMSLFAPGMIPGDGVYARVNWLVGLRGGRPPRPSLAEVSARLNASLAAAADVVRSEFGGAVTYASGTWENVDWTPFDLVGVDYYRAEQTREEYAQGLRDLHRHGKPVAVLEVGCCTYPGADRRGGTGWMVLDEWAPGGPRWLVDPVPIRDEAAQSRYLAEQFEIFLTEDLHAAFVYTFRAPYLDHSATPERDFDRASFALTTNAIEPGTPRDWIAKDGFRTLAGIFAAAAAS